MIQPIVSRLDVISLHGQQAPCCRMRSQSRCCRETLIPAAASHAHRIAPSKPFSLRAHRVSGLGLQGVGSNMKTVAVLALSIAAIPVATRLASNLLPRCDSLSACQVEF